MSELTQSKTCTKCGEVKSLDEFSRSNRNKTDGRVYWCKACVRAYQEANRERISERKREYREANRERIREQQREYNEANRERFSERKREYDLRRKYKLTLAQYEAMLDAQGGGCAICGVAECPSGRALAVDHDHACCPGSTSCGQCVRGLLCTMCNTAIGKTRDSPALLRRAADYLERA